MKSLRFASIGATLRRILPALCLVLLLMTLAACSNDDDEGSGDTAVSDQDEFCSDLDALRTDLRSLATAVATFDRSKIDDALTEVQEDVDDVRSSSQAMRADDSQDIEKAFDALKQAVQAVGQGGGLSTNLRDIQSALTDLVNATSTAISEHDCRT